MHRATGASGHRLAEPDSQPLGLRAFVGILLREPSRLRLDTPQESGKIFGERILQKPTIRAMEMASIFTGLNPWVKLISDQHGNRHVAPQLLPLTWINIASVPSPAWPHINV